ncbi:MAG: SCO family protein, partial [Bacteroidetes bacterium]
QQMIRVYDAFEGNDTVKILSHTLFPEVDSVAVLHSYAAKLGIESSRWHMVTGDQDTIFSMAHSYMIAAVKDEKAAGGILHSGAFILLDGQRHIRGYYDGTNAEEVDRLIKDIRTLLHERSAS